MMRSVVALFDRREDDHYQPTITAVRVDTDIHSEQSVPLMYLVPSTLEMTTLTI